MKYFFLCFLFLFLFSCASNDRVFWCGDHACVNKKEKDEYFKKTMIVEVRKLDNKNKKSKSEIEIIKKQINKDEKKKINTEKNLAKKAKLEEKMRIKEEKELVKQAKLEEKRMMKQEKELAKQAKLEEKIKSTTKKKTIQKKITLSSSIDKIDIPSSDFNILKKKISQKNIFRPYPDINDIPN